MPQDFGLDAKVVRYFFDKAVVINAVKKGTLQAFSKAGAFIRQRARTSMKRRKQPAKAGSPPSAHEGSLKEKIYFAYDPSAASVVIGPVKYKDGIVPKLLEFGGDESRNTRRGDKINLHYAGNPFMKPALDAELAAGTLPKQWAGSVKG